VPVSANPQGVLAAPVGTLAVRACDGSVYVKTGGGSTAFGWYLLPGGDQYLNWQANWVSAATQLTVNRNTQSIAVAPTTLINFLPTKSTAGNEFSPRKSYVGGYTSGVGGNSFLYRLTNNTDSMPTQRIDSSVLNDFQEFDWICDLVTTPRSSSVAGSTDLTTNAMRIWAGFVWGGTAVQAVGGTVSSDNIYTEWPSPFTATNGLFGAAFRFSSAIDGGLWQCVTGNAPGGVQAQTVTPMSAIAANTAYRLRMRFVLVSGVLTCLASINDGTEIAIVGNVGPGATPVPNQTQPFQPLVSVRQINATVKSLAVSQIGLWYGLGVGLSC